jgi:hypothetical protein
MKKLFLYTLMCLSTLAVSFLASCKKDVSVTPSTQKSDYTVAAFDLEGVKVVNGVLHFDNGASFKKALDLIGKSNFENYKAFCNKIGFVSQSLIFDEAVSRLEKASSKEDYEQFKLSKSNNDIFKFDAGYIDYKMESIMMRDLVGEDKKLFIGNALYYFDEKGFIVVKDGNEEKLTRAKISRQTHSQEGVLVGKSILKLQTRAACGVEQNTGWVTGSSNRRGILYVNVEASAPVPSGSSGSFYNVSFYAVHRARAQKKVLGAWYDYSTFHSIDVNDVAQGENILNGQTQPVLAPLQFNFSGTGNGIQAYDFISIWNNVSEIEALFASSFRLPFVSISSTYGNQGGVNTSINCQ